MPQNDHEPSTHFESFDDTVREVMTNPVARVAATENALRRQISAVIFRACEEHQVSPTKLPVPAAQLRRLLHEELGGALELGAICRAADALGLRVEIALKKRDGGGDQRSRTSRRYPPSR